jgi:hypothetical protein
MGVVDPKRGGEGRGVDGVVDELPPRRERNDVAAHPHLADAPFGKVPPHAV